MSNESTYWIIVLITLIVLLRKYYNNNFLILIILFFYEGLFTYYGKISWNAFKIFLPIFALYCIFQQQKYINSSRENRIIVIAFVIFSTSFILSSLINNDYFTLFLNQFSRYLLPLLSFFLIQAHINKRHSFESLNNLIKKLLSIQIFLSIVNYLLMGLHENIVGSIGAKGGSAASIIPILGFIFIWLKNDGVLKRNDWVYLALLLFIGYVSMKRAIWIVAPIIVMLMVYYVPQKKINRNFILLIPAITLFLYLGIRLNPTFNREGKVWGSFDFDYFYNYSKNYTFGNIDDSKTRVGRGGATLLTLENIFSYEKEKSLLGNGLLKMYTWEKETEEEIDSDVKISNINSVTMATGLFQNYYTGGILGVVTFLSFMLILFYTVKNNRIRNVLILFFLWEYAFYANALIRTPSLSFLLVYLVIYSNNMYYRSTIIPQNAQAKTVNSLS